MQFKNRQIEFLLTPINMPIRVKYWYISKTIKVFGGLSNLFVE